MARNKAVEDELTRQGFAFEFVPNYKIAGIDMAEADANEARLGQKLHTDTVVGYAMAMEEGADWMAIVVRAITGNRLDQLINGRHTIAAMGLAKPARVTVDAYRIREPDPVRVDMLIRTINISNGRQPDTGERLVHVAEMRRVHPHITIKELSLRFKIKREKIVEYMAVIAAEKRGDDLGVGHMLRGGRHFGVELKKALNSMQNDAVFLNTVQLIAAHPLDLRGEAGLELIATLRGAGTETKAMRIIEARDKELNLTDVERKIKPTRSPSARITRFLSAARGVLKQFPGTVEKLYIAGLGGWRQMRREAKMLDDVISREEEVRDAMLAMADEMERAEEWANRRPGRPSSEPTSPKP